MKKEEPQALLIKAGKIEKRFYETCTNISEELEIFECSKCKVKISSLEHIPAYGGYAELVYMPNYCPNCGRRIDWRK